VSPTLDLLSSVVNNISFVSPPAPPLSQPEDIPADALCPVDADGLPECPGGESYCTCANVIKIPLGSVVQIILSDNSKFQLHKYSLLFWDLRFLQRWRHWRRSRLWRCVVFLVDTNVSEERPGDGDITIQ
jgi:hypothetical protein